MLSADRWRYVADTKWDTLSSKSLDSQRVKFFWIAPFREVQLQMGISDGYITDDAAKDLRTSLNGAVINCKTGEYGIFYYTGKNEQGDSIIPTMNKNENEIQMKPIPPETIIEELMFDV